MGIVSTPIEPVKAASARFGPVWTLGAIAARPPKPRELLFGDVIGRGERVMLSGPQKRGMKSWFGLGLALHLAQGADFLNLAIPASAVVLYVNAEMGEEAFNERLRGARRALSAHDLADSNLHVVHTRGKGLGLQDPTLCIELCSLARDLGAALVIIDPISEAASIDENDGKAVVSLLQNLQDSLAEAGIASLLIHHWPKGTPGKGAAGGLRARGSAKWAEHQDASILSEPLDGLSATVRLTFETRNCAAPEPLVASLADDAGLVLTSIAPASALSTTPKEAERILSLLREAGRIPQSRLAERLGMTEPTLSRRLKGLEERGMVRRLSGSREAGEDTRAKYVEIVAANHPTISGAAYDGN